MAKLSVNDSIEAFVDCVYDAVCYVKDSYLDANYLTKSTTLINPSIGYADPPSIGYADPLYCSLLSPAVDFFSCGGEHEYVKPELAQLFRNVVLDECIRFRKEDSLEDRTTFRDSLWERLGCYCFIRTLLKDSSQSKESQLLLEFS